MHGTLFSTLANELDQSSNSFVLYFTARSRDNSRVHCVGAATASSPIGPFNPAGQPLACHDSEGGAIDPSGFYDPVTNKRFVTYKVDGNNYGNGGNCNNGNDPIHATPIMLLEVASDGVTPLGGPRTILDRNDADGPLVEAPSLARLGDKYFLFFSSNCYDKPLYDSSFAVADSIYGPYTKRGPLLLTGDMGLTAPGGLEMAADGKHAAFHAGPVGSRLMYTAEITYNGGTQITICSNGNGGCKTVD
jgi:beta-xylosidase